MTNYTEHVKIVFPLPKDDDGYPPDDVESLWASPRLDGTFTIDNVPFFVRGVSSGDVVTAYSRCDRLIFGNLVSEGGHSTIRVLVSDESSAQQVREDLRNLGCSSELSHIPGLIAVDVPPSVRYAVIRTFLERGEAAGRWEYEEGCIAGRA